MRSVINKTSNKKTKLANENLFYSNSYVSNESQYTRKTGIWRSSANKNYFIAQYQWKCVLKDLSVFFPVVLRDNRMLHLKMY